MTNLETLSFYSTFNEKRTLLWKNNGKKKKEKSFVELKKLVNEFVEQSE